MTVDLVICTRCSEPMTAVDLMPVYKGIIPTICGDCREELAKQVDEAKTAFYGEKE